MRNSGDCAGSWSRRRTRPAAPPSGTLHSVLRKDRFQRSPVLASASDIFSMSNSFFSELPDRLEELLDSVHAMPNWQAHVSFALSLASPAGYVPRSKLAASAGTRGLLTPSRASRSDPLLKPVGPGEQVSKTNSYAASSPTSAIQWQAPLPEKSLSLRPPLPLPAFHRSVVRTT